MSGLSSDRFEMGLVKAFRRCLVVWLCGVLGFAHADPSVLTLPCYGANGSPLARTEMLAIRTADLEAGRSPMRASADSGKCSISLEPGIYWVKAQSPDARSVPILIRWPARSIDRVLTLVPTKGLDSAMQRALAAMVRRDQEARNALGDAQREGDTDRVTQLEKDMEAIDAENQSQLRRWLAAKGFPRAQDVGWSGVGDAWLLIQHSQMIADQLPAMRAAAEVGELARSNLALSEDRALMYAGQPQRYGSQLKSGADGKLALYPLESPEQVDALRESMDLEPLADYLKRFPR